MIVLLFEPAGLFLPDELLLSITSLDPAATVQYYCSWINTPSDVLPYRNSGGFIIGPPAPINVPPPTLIPPQVQEITEITIYNPGPSPISVSIDFQRGATGISSRLMRCALPGEQTLSYNATIGGNGSWRVYDNSSFLISPR